MTEYFKITHAIAITAVPCDYQIQIINSIQYLNFPHPPQHVYLQELEVLWLQPTVLTYELSQTAGRGSWRGIERDPLLLLIFSLFFMIGLTHLSIIRACYVGNEPSAMIGRTLLLLRLLDLRTAREQRRVTRFLRSLEWQTVPAYLEVKMRTRYAKYVRVGRSVPLKQKVAEILLANKKAG